MSISIPIPIEINVDVKNGNSVSVVAAYAESLKMILKHVADFHITVVDIISEKYNIPVDEIMKTITLDSRYANMLVDPNIHRLTSNVEISISNSHLNTKDTKDTKDIKNDSGDKDKIENIVHESFITIGNKKKIKIKKTQV
jgi:hypothetical protein